MPGRCISAAEMQCFASSTSLPVKAQTRLRCYASLSWLQLTGGCWIRLTYDKAAGQMHIVKLSDKTPGAQAHQQSQGATGSRTAAAGQRGTSAAGSHQQPKAKRKRQQEDVRTTAEKTRGSREAEAGPAAAAASTAPAAAGNVAVSPGEVILLVAGAVLILAAVLWRSIAIPCVFRCMPLFELEELMVFGQPVCRVVTITVLASPGREAPASQQGSYN